jgi:hypothetical protein
VARAAWAGARHAASVDFLLLSSGVLRDCAGQWGVIERAAALAGAALCLFACATSIAPLDAGGPFDAGGGFTEDAGGDGNVPDASVPRPDAGADGAAADDGGALFDGGVARDGGAPFDGGAARDGGSADAGACPAEMALAGSACVDRWEAATIEVTDGGERPHSPYESVAGKVVRAVSAPDQVPQGYIHYVEAKNACIRAGKRLCTLAEWMRACRGADTRDYYPYGGQAKRAGVCNEGRAVHPVVQLFDAGTGIWDPVHMNDPRINQQPDTLARTGAYSGCRGPDGTFDMVGNLHEWIEDAAGTFKGGFYVDAELNGHGCLYTTTAHAGTYHDYSTGFRCCRDPSP